jgi:hypothetical protein
MIASGRIGALGACRSASSGDVTITKVARL